MAPRPWITQRLPELVGIKGACEILGVKKMTLNRWMQPGSGKSYSSHGPEHTFMIEPRRIDPVEEGEDVKPGWPVWARGDVERFAIEVGRQRAPVGQGADGGDD